MKMNSSESVYEKLYLVPTNIYEKVMKECDNEERSEISNLNEANSEVPLSMNTGVHNIDKSSSENSDEMSSNLKSVLSENSAATQNLKEPDQESIQQRNASNPKGISVMNKTVDSESNDDDCPPTSKNSILKIKPYLCNSCSKRYATLFTLKRHWNNKRGLRQSKPSLAVKKNSQDQIKPSIEHEKVLESNTYEPSRKRKISDVKTLYDYEEAPLLKLSLIHI